MSMEIETNLQGRLRNTSLPYRHGLLPLFEAVVNSIHSVEDAGLSSENGSITVEIIRDRQQRLDLKSSGKRREITGFGITDNGVGFTEPNMKSFLTLDSQYKADKGGRGVGRLLWLKAFAKVDISSIYKDDDGKLRSRRFSFTSSGIRGEKNGPASSEPLTCVRLDGFGGKYRKSSPGKADDIANSLFEHCLWYFVREGGAPCIVIEDEGKSIRLDDIYKEHAVASDAESFTVKKRDFDLRHIRLRANLSRSHVIAFCAARRLVKEESLAGKIPGLYGKLSDRTGEFVYACYVTSPFLDETVRSERTGFDITENTGDLFAFTEISLSDIRDAVIARSSAYLSGYLEKNKNTAKERVENFVSRKAPRYRPIMKRIPEDKLIIDPDISEKELELTLHRFLAEIEEQLLSDGHDLMNPKADESFQDYRKRLREYLRTAEDIKKSDLANYVSHRRVILELLEKAIQRGSDGQYTREDLIHNLIMPMRSDSDDLMPDSCNLWLIDERLAFHNYLASDKTLLSMPISGSAETKEPDILALNVFDNPILVSEGNKLPLASIVVVEIKRPMRNDAAAGETGNAVEQAVGYLKRIRDGKVRTASGRIIPNSGDIPGFCYAICDITAGVKERCEILGLTPTSDYLGYFGYNPNYKVYIEVISFDRLVNAAKERNKAFFDKLGLPTT